MTGTNDQLETDLVFIDTEAFARERLDWESKSFSRLKELVKSGHLRILTTRITKEEVRSRIREALSNASGAVKKHEVVLGQLGVGELMQAPSGTDSATKLEQMFEEFMGDVRAVEIPISRDVDGIFDSYFQQRPPFSAKKKSEFPDAFVVSSLQEKAKSGHKKIYIVSADADMKACCEHAEQLILVDSITEVISRATVTKAVHDNLFTFMQRSGRLRASLEESLHAAEINIEGRHGDDGITDFDASLVDADQITILSSNVISGEADEFTAEIEFEACLILELNFTFKSRSPFGSEYESGRLHISYSHAQVFYAEVVVRYDPDEPSESEIVSIHCDPVIEIDPADIEPLSRRRRF